MRFILELIAYAFIHFFQNIWALLDVLYGVIIGYPLADSEPIVSDERKYYAYRGLPALALIFLTGVVVIAASIDSDSIYRTYRAKMESAMANKDYKVASVLGSRIMAEGIDLPPDFRLLFAQSLLSNNEAFRAESILNDLAPDESPGYPPAHSMRAFMMAEVITRGKADPKSLSKLKWHLDNCQNERRESLYQLRASYYVRVNEVDAAIEQLKLATKINPRNAIPLSDLYLQTGAVAIQQRVLRDAITEIDRQLEASPFDKELRLISAIALVKRKDYVAAEKALRTGYDLIPDAEVARALADFYLLRHDDSSKNDPNNLVARLGFLEAAIAADRNHEGIYLRLSQLYSESLNQAEASKIRGILEAMIADGKSPALAHFALGTVAMVDGNQKDAIWHLKQAFLLDKQIPMVCNNLAWIMAHSDTPDLENAILLSRTAVEKFPNDPEFRDTYGTILAKQGKLQESVAEFESLLATISDKGKIHKKLAQIYSRLGQTSLAQMHEERSKQ